MAKHHYLVYLLLLLVSAAVAVHLQWIAAEETEELQASTLASEPNADNACWKNSYGRGVGSPLSQCRNGEQKDGALCYPQCANGYYGVGPVCWQYCPNGYRNDGAYCAKPAAYGRGAGYALWDEGKCKRENPQGCEKDGLIWYPKCRAGYRKAGCCICSPVCPDGMTDIGVSCQKKSYGRTAGKPMICASGLQEDAGLCYNYCRSPFTGVGPVCWQPCPSSKPFECGAMCTTDQSVCSERVSKVVIAIVTSAAKAANKDPEAVVDAAEAASQLNLPQCPQQ